MERLTVKRIGIGEVKGFVNVSCDEICKNHICETCPIQKIFNKLAEYEEAVEQLEKVYGEHDGLLETVVKSLVKYNGEKPRKARLLTDEDADKWEVYKNLEEHGLLIRLPCKVGDTVYMIVGDIDEDGKVTNIMIDTDVIQRISIRKNTKVFTGEYSASYEENFCKTVFLTKEEAEAALERMNENA